MFRSKYVRFGEKEKPTIQARIELALHISKMQNLHAIFLILLIISP